MLKLNKKVEYGLTGILYMSEKPPGELTQAREIAEIFDISRDLMGQILHRLTKQDLIASVQGKQGGFHISAPLERITLYHVITAIEGPINFMPMADQENPALDQYGIRSPFQNFQELIVNFFKIISLKDLKTNLPHTISNYPFLKALIFFRADMNINALDSLIMGQQKT